MRVIQYAIIFLLAVVLHFSSSAMVENSQDGLASTSRTSVSGELLHVFPSALNEPIVIPLEQIENTANGGSTRFTFDSSVDELEHTVLLYSVVGCPRCQLDDRDMAIAGTVEFEWSSVYEGWASTLQAESYAPNLEIIRVPIEKLNSYSDLDKEHLFLHWDYQILGLTETYSEIFRGRMDGVWSPIYIMCDGERGDRRSCVMSYIDDYLLWNITIPRKSLTEFHKVISGMSRQLDEWRSAALDNGYGFEQEEFQYNLTVGSQVLEIPKLYLAILVMRQEENEIGHVGLQGKINLLTGNIRPGYSLTMEEEGPPSEVLFSAHLLHETMYESEPDVEEIQCSFGIVDGEASENPWYGSCYYDFEFDDTYYGSISFRMIDEEHRDDVVLRLKTFLEDMVWMSRDEGADRPDRRSNH